MATATHEHRIELFDRLRRGDPAALAELMQAEHDYLIGLATRCLMPPLRDVCEPADVVQEVAVRVVRHNRPLRFEHRSQFRAWLATVTHNCLADLHRRHFRTARRIPSPHSLDATGSQFGGGASESAPSLAARIPGHDRAASSVARLGEDRLLLQRALTALKPEQRRLLERVYFEHTQLVDIAALDGRSPGAVRMQFGRAVQACGRELERLSTERARQRVRPERPSDGRRSNEP